VRSGFFDDLPVPSGCADLVVACSVLTPAPGHGGDAGLAEMERVCRPGGCVAILWPNNLGWLAAHGYQYESFAGPMAVEFASHREAVELAGIFYPHAVSQVRRLASRRVPYEVLGINPPRDLAFKVIG
jgi:SAM-dependent methyltransferase